MIACFECFSLQVRHHCSFSSVQPRLSPLYSRPSSVKAESSSPCGFDRVASCRMRAAEFFFDISCPYAYLASTRLDIVRARTHATLNVRPILLGGVFKAVGSPANL